MDKPAKNGEKTKTQIKEGGLGSRREEVVGENFSLVNEAVSM